MDRLTFPSPTDPEVWSRHRCEPRDDSARRLSTDRTEPSRPNKERPTAPAECGRNLSSPSSRALSVINRLSELGRWHDADEGRRVCRSRAVDRPQAPHDPRTGAVRAIRPGTKAVVGRRPDVRRGLRVSEEARPCRRRATVYACPDGGKPGDGEPRRPGRPRGDLRPSGRPSDDRPRPGEAGRTGPLVLLGGWKGLACGHAGGRVGEALAREGQSPADGQYDRQSIGAATGYLGIRERGFAVDDEEHAVGLRCVAALVFDELREPMAALSISGPTTRISHSNIPRLGELLRQKAAGITAKLGGAGPAAL